MIHVRNFSLLCSIVFSPFDRPLTHKSFFNIVYFLLISLRSCSTVWCGWNVSTRSKNRHNSEDSWMNVVLVSLYAYHQLLIIYTCQSWNLTYIYIKSFSYWKTPLFFSFFLFFLTKNTQVSSIVDSTLEFDTTLAMDGKWPAIDISTMTSVPTLASQPKPLTELSRGLCVLCFFFLSFFLLPY